MFRVIKFDKNNDADNACKELFKEQPHSSKKSKIKSGKVTKKKLKKKQKSDESEEKIKEAVKNILQNSLEAIPTKIKSKKKKKKKTAQQIEQKQPIISTDEAQTNTPKKKKKQKKRKNKQMNDVEKQTEIVIEPDSEPNQTLSSRQKKKKDKLKQNLQQILTPEVPTPPTKRTKPATLRERMMERLQSARFRYINEQIYTTDSKEAQKYFKEDPLAFPAYHEGYRQQVEKWPLNPVDVIIKSIKKLPKSYIVADFGCGEAKLAQSVQQKVHSFDLVAMKEIVVPCDMAHVPLEPTSVDVVVFCLSLMGTNLTDYLLEANRVLRIGGVLKIAEVESRFDDVKIFIENVTKLNFKLTWSDLSHNLFYFMDFKKEANVKKKRALPVISLKPCLYKKR